MNDYSVMRCDPLVAAIDDYYLICIPVRRPVLLSISVGERTYFCHSNGIRISDAKVQKFKIPMVELDREKAYRVTYEVVTNRTNRVCEKEEAVTFEYAFRPVTKTEGINICHISDVHGLKSLAIRAGNRFAKEADLLILNGDISSKSMSTEDILLTYDIASALTHGEIPCIVTRGNHDLRGRFAEKLAVLLPTDEGRTYFTVKLGVMWFMVLDCGEDKVDEHREYSGTVCCHEFRLEETAFIEDVVKRASFEYLCDKYKYRIIVSHVPFNNDNTDECKGERPFNIEHGLYCHWCDLIREKIKPMFLLAGHVHTSEVFKSGSDFDAKNIGCDTIVSGVPVKKNGRGVNYFCCNVKLFDDKFDVTIGDGNFW